MKKFLETLTPRQREAYDLRASGKSDIEVAASMGVTVRCVADHMMWISKKAKARGFVWAKVLVKKGG